MTTAIESKVDAILVTAKSHEVQRAMFAAARGDHQAAARHDQAAAHLELVLAEEYQQAGSAWMARRSLISAGSCLWTCGEMEHAQAIFDQLTAEAPDRIDEIQEIMTELRQQQK